MVTEGNRILFRCFEMSTSNFPENITTLTYYYLGSFLRPHVKLN